MQLSEKEEFIPALANLSSGCFALKLSGKLGVRLFDPLRLLLVSVPAE